MKRIIIIGATGSGKTTLGRKISEKLALPAIDLDEIHWLPGWQERDLAQARQMVDAATSAPAWVISGNYRKLSDIFWPKADTVVWIDYPFPLVFWRLLRRSILRIVDRQPICNGNYESARLFFSKKSIMLWLFQTYWKRKREYGEIFAHPEERPHLAFVRLKSPEETESWLKAL